MRSKGSLKSGYRIISALIACALMSSAALIAARLLNEHDFKDCKTIYVCVNSKTWRSDDTAWRHEYLYDDMGNLILDKCYSKDEILSETIETIYDDNSAIKELKFYDSDGEVYQWQKKVYDYAERKLTETAYNVMGPGNSKEEYTYDEQGNMLTFKEIWGDSIHLRESTYDDNGNCILEKEFSNGELQSYYESTYDDKDNLVLWKKFRQGEQDFYKEYIYDDNGNMLSLKDFNADGTVRYLEEHSYDRHSNMLSLTKYYRDNESETYIEYEYKKMRVPIENSVDTSFADYLDASWDTSSWTAWAV